MCFNLVSQILNAKAVGKDGVGTIAMYQAASLLISGFFSLGTHQPVIRMGSGWLDSKDKLGRLLGVSFVLDQIAAFAAGLVFWAAVSLFGLLNSTPIDHDEAKWFYVAVVLSSGTSWALGTLRLFNQFRIIGLVTVLTSVWTILVSITFLMFEVSLHYYLDAYAVILLLHNLCINFSGWYIAKRRGYSLLCKPSDFRKLPEKKHYSEFIVSSYFAGTVDVIVRHMDVIVLGKFASTAEAGVYAVAKQIVAGSNKLLTSISTIMFPELSAMAEKRDVMSGKRFFLGTASALVVSVMLGCLFVFIAGDLILTLIFGSPIENGSNILMLTFVASTFKLGVAILAGFLVSFGRPRANFIVYAIGGLGYILTVFPLVDSLGSLGAAGAQFVYGGLLMAAVIVATIAAFRAKSPTPVDSKSS